MAEALQFILFPVLFVGMWLLVSYRTAQAGWTTLAAKYRTTVVPAGAKVGAVSGQIVGGFYQSSLASWPTEVGFFLRPILLFRAFHVTLFIPWTSVTTIREEKKLFAKWTVIECETDDVSFLLRIPGSRGRAFAAYAPKKA